MLGGGEDHDLVVVGHELQEDVHERSQPHEHRQESLVVATRLVELVVEVFHQFRRRVHQRLVEVQHQQFLSVKAVYLWTGDSELGHLWRIDIWFLLVAL